MEGVATAARSTLGAQAIVIVLKVVCGVECSRLANLWGLSLRILALWRSRRREGGCLLGLLMLKYMMCRMREPVESERHFVCGWTLGRIGQADVSNS